MCMCACMHVWMYCCLTDSWGNYSSTVAVTLAQPLRLNPRTLALMNPRKEANAKTYNSSAENIPTKWPGQERWTEWGGEIKKREGEVENKRKKKRHKLAETDLTNQEGRSDQKRKEEEENYLSPCKEEEWRVGRPKCCKVDNHHALLLTGTGPK